MPFLSSVLRKFPDEFAAHVKQAGCPFRSGSKESAA